jgi:hypothetical protein
MGDLKVAERGSVSTNNGTKSFTNEIKDFTNKGGRVIHDSAEMSYRHTLIEHAKDLGYKENSGMDIKKWAEIETDKYMKTPEGQNLRYAVTHDGNKLVLEKGLDGKIHAHIDNASGTPSVVDRDFYENHESSSGVDADKENIPKAKVVNSAPAVSPEVVNQRMTSVVDEVFGKNGVRGSGWNGVAKLRVSDVLNNNDAINNKAEFLRTQGILKNVNPNQFKSIQEVVISGKSLGVSPVPNENVGSYVRRILEKQITNRK